MCLGQSEAKESERAVVSAEYRQNKQNISSQISPRALLDEFVDGVLRQIDRAPGGGDVEFLDLLQRVVSQDVCHVRVRHPNIL